jgi:radical SAM protein with 4Fe4S-binding SPASM domain
MKFSQSIKSTDILRFADNIVIKKHDGFLIAISVDAGNWIIFETEFQKKILEDLIEGKTIGEVFRQHIKTEQQKNEFLSLLKRIFARKFATINTELKIDCLQIESYKKLYIYLTNECNLRCTHCFMYAGSKLTNELCTNEWKSLITDFKQLGGEMVTFTGGEPIMHNGFAEIIKYAHDIGLFVSVLSNGTLWNEQQIDELSQYISEIQISIDGVDDKSYSLVRGKKMFNHAVDTVVRFANKGVRTYVASTFTFENIADVQKYDQLIELIKARTNNCVFFKLSKKMLPGRYTKYSDKENKHYFEVMKAEQEKIDKNSSYVNFILGHEPNVVSRNCGFGSLSIGADGNVYTCNRIIEVDVLGNIRQQPLEIFIEKAKQINEKTSVDKVAPCSSCHLKYICCGGCRIDDFNFQGKLDNWNEAIMQIKCNNSFKYNLEETMINSFNYFYKF